MSSIAFFKDWPREEYPQAVRECLQALREYIPKRNLQRSYRASALNAIEQARYLGITKVGQMPRTEPRAAARPTETEALSSPPGQIDLFDRNTESPAAAQPAAAA